MYDANGDAQSPKECPMFAKNLRTKTNLSTNQKGLPCYRYASACFQSEIWRLPASVCPSDFGCNGRVLFRV